MILIGHQKVYEYGKLDDLSTSQKINNNEIYEFYFAKK